LEKKLGCQYASGQRDELWATPPSQHGTAPASHLTDHATQTKPGQQPCKTIPSKAGVHAHPRVPARNVSGVCWNASVTTQIGPAQIGPVQLARLLRVPEPTPEQAAVIAAPLGPMAVIAGAGSGKSETMAARLVWLAANGMVRPDRVLGLTFTRKAAAELADRVRSRLERLRRAGLGENTQAVSTAGRPDGENPFDGDPVIGTYHAYAGRLVGDNALREGLEPSMRLITPALSWQLAAGIVAAYDGPMDEIIWTPQTVTAALLDLAGDLAEHLRDAGDVTAVGEWLAAELAVLPGRVPAAVRKIMETQRAREQLLPLIERYAAAKAAREVLDHGDQVALAARIASRHPEVGAGERARYQVVLLDEYQDTSHAQLVLLRSLFGGGHPVTAVGDPCQSIYGWRGASAGNLRRFTVDFPVVARVRPVGASASSGPAPVLVLSTSFRNSAQVLEASAVIQEELRYEAPDVPRLVSGPDRSARGAVTCALLDTVLDEADWVAGQVAALLAVDPGCAPDGQPWPDGRPAGVRPSDIAVLCRKRAQFVPLRRAIEARGVPVEVVGLGGLLVVPEVQDVVATLRVLQDAGASDALARLLTGPRWRIGPRDLVALGRRARALVRGEGDGRRPASQRDADADAIADAITDLTAESGSLVEALDDLGEAGAYSAAGYARMHALAGELRWLRAHIGRPLADLAAEVERVLGLDIEVAARPGADPVAARADLDAFTDVAAAFTGEGAEPTLGAFLAYLAAAQQEEFGLETGRVGESDSVKLLTVHAAKGLQWPAVFVPGLSAGERSQVFPAKPRLSTRWTDNARLIPFSLRGDAGDLPELRGLDASSREAFMQGCAARNLAEERRLMYVATTRAAFWLGCSGYWWAEGSSSRLGPSPFLDEVRTSGAARLSAWADEPEADAENPLLATVEAADWPRTPAGRRYEAIREAAALVEAAVEPTPDDLDTLSAADQALVAAWLRDGDLLLAERAQRRNDNGTQVALPARLSVSSLVSLARDPAELARHVRRPMPRPPARQARRGTAFHQWLEQRYGQQLLIDDSDLFGADDDATGSAGDGDLAELRAQFERSEWADRWPQAVEVPFETLIGDRLIRGRIDAVFKGRPASRPVGQSSGRPAGGADPGFDVVDWKTGSPPRNEAERYAVSVQLAAYRLAWAALADVPVAAVRAAFHYVRHNQTVRPADLLDEAGLAALIEQVPVAD
jgi:DNA helicase-2/ATP-dependent DNA helicase PcrA